jgi:hypothetical protein
VNNIDLSIIIVNWNTRDLLAQCLASIYAHPPDGTFEIFVVDNASSDGSAQMVQKQFPSVRSIPNEENVGFARANNQAIRMSSGRHVLLLNPDTKILPDALQTLLTFIEEHPEAGAIGPMVLNPDLSLQSSCDPMPTLGREFWRLMHLDRLLALSVYHEELWDPSLPRTVDVIQGNCMLIRQEALLDVGLLDETYFMFTEEVDFCYRLLQKNWQIYWVPQAQLIHYGGQSTRQAAQEMFIELYRSKLLFFRKNHGAMGSMVYKFILFVTTLTRIPGGVLRLQGTHPSTQRSRLYLSLLRALPAM